MNLVYRYGLRRPTQNAELVREQMFAAARYRNTLVEIERGRRAAMRAAYAECSSIKAVYEDRDKAEEIAKKNGGRVVSVTTKSERAVREERDAAVRRANQERTIEDLGEALASAIDERDAALAALAKLADVDRLLAIEEQAKRVARAERWHEWACLAHLDAHLSARTRTEDLRDALIALNEASDALDAECHKLAEMVGEGDET